MNDMLSYQKEEGEEVPHNLVALLRMSGKSAQEAFDTLGLMLDESFAEWDALVANLPSWGTQLDAPVQEYVQGIGNVVAANLYWR